MSSKRKLWLAVVVIAHVYMLVVNTELALRTMWVLLLAFQLYQNLFKWWFPFNNDSRAKYIAKRDSYDEDDQVIGYRYAELLVSGDRVRYGPIFWTGDFGTTARAICTISTPTHEAPEEGCKCGFYSVRDVGKLVRAVGAVYPLRCILQVRISGKVVETERGYRANQQDVLQVFLPSECRECEAATAFMQISSEHEDAEDWAHLSPCCELHLDPDRQFFSVQQLREALLTEVEVV